MKFYIGVACKTHVENGVKNGFCQFCHGKSSPTKKLRRDDFIVYYSSKVEMDKPQLYQKFTGIGRVSDDEAYQFDMGNGFQPFRRNVDFFDAPHVDIGPLIPHLPFIKNKKSWGATFRYGFFQIDQESFSVISESMLGFDPSRV